MEKSGPGEKLEELWNFYNFQVVCFVEQLICY